MPAANSTISAATDPNRLRVKPGCPCLGNPARQKRDYRIGQQISACRTQQLCDASRPCRGKHRQSHRSPGQIQRGCGESPPASQRKADQQHAEIREGQRNRRKRQRQRQPRANGNHCAGANNNSCLLNKTERLLCRIRFQKCLRHFRPRYDDGLSRTILLRFLGGRSFGLLSRTGFNRFGGRRRFSAQMLLHPEVDRQNHGDDGYGAQHQNRKQNLDHHRDSGYQNEQGRTRFSRSKPSRFTRMKIDSIMMKQSRPVTINPAWIAAASDRFSPLPP